MIFLVHDSNYYVINNRNINTLGNLVKYGISAVLFLMVHSSLLAHFQVVLPPTELLKKPEALQFDIRFTHPMENGPIMNMGIVKSFGVMVDGKKKDLTATLKNKQIAGKKAYTAHYKVTRPGDYLFYLEPAPYWEPVEQKMIIHYTKVCVSAMNVNEGWDAMVGFPVEIEPLVRPYGLYKGNSFRGIIKHNGRPVPFATVEVEYLNNKNEFKAPNDAFVTQVIKADANGGISNTGIDSVSPAKAHIFIDYTGEFSRLRIGQSIGGATSYDD